MRDSEQRYNGKGVTNAVANVNKFSDTELIEEIDILNLINFDKKLCKCDGTQLKENLGGNATTALSFVAYRQEQKLANKELFQHFYKTYFATKKDKKSVVLQFAHTYGEYFKWRKTRRWQS